MKKGFTLIELIGVVIVLGLISILALPPLVKLIKGTENDLSSANKELIITAASQYVNKYSEDFVIDNDIIYCLTVKDLIKEDLLSSNMKISQESKVKVEVKNNKYNYSLDDECKGTPKLTELLKAQYNDSNTKGLLKDSTGYYYTGTNAEVANNFVWYEGHLWRVLTINNDDTVTMVTQQPITTIQPATSSWTTEQQYKDSYINTWLNNTFYNSITDKSKIQTSTFNVGIYNDVTEITTSQKVGLLDEAQYTKAGLVNSFLDKKNYFWLGNRYSSSNVRYVSNAGSPSSDSPANAIGSHPVIKISDLTVTKGDGTLANPFREASKSTNTINVRVGEYISIPGSVTYCKRTGEEGKCLFRVVSKDANSVKVILNGLLPTASAFGSNAVFNVSSTIYTLLSDFGNNIPDTYRYTENKNFNIGTYGNGSDYATLNSAIYSGSFGLPTVGEMLSGNDIDMSYSINKEFINPSTIENPTVSDYYWTINQHNSSYVRLVSSFGSLLSDIPANARGVRPVIFLNSGAIPALTFTKGDGTAENPYRLGE